MFIVGVRLESRQLMNHLYKGDRMANRKPGRDKNLMNY